jgi:hypothetical protein
LGIGEGAFIFAAYRRFAELGANAADAQRQLYGAEIDPLAYEAFSRSVRALDLEFPNLCNANFFEIDFPLVDVIVGNPPFVRRTFIENVGHTRQAVIKKNPMITEKDLPRLTDLYVYFLLYALPALKPGGRLAIITADPWLNVGYGKGLRKYLLENFEIEHLVSFDRRIFNNAQVKPVLVLATRRTNTSVSRYVQFLRIKNGLPISSIQHSIEAYDRKDSDIARTRIEHTALNPADTWDIHFKAPIIYEELASHSFMTPIGKLAETRIGVQTLAKEFFVLSPDQAARSRIEPEFLAPLAQSPRYLDRPVIEEDTPPAFFLFYCSKSREDLRGTFALSYIEQGESTEVLVRGKQVSVTGYQNKERMRRSHRRVWYDLRSAIERRGCAAILVPRLMFRSFFPVWNKAGFVPGELFIEFMPFREKAGDTEVYLAILTSSVTEIMLRAHAQVYGGGTYNMNPGQFKKVPIINANWLSESQKDNLRFAYKEYVSSEVPDRTAIDNLIFEALGFDAAKKTRVRGLLEDLHVIAISSKKAASANP